MTIIRAYVIEDSVAANGKRLTTLELTYPRWIHAEGRTHRQIAIDEEDDGVIYGTGVPEAEFRTPSIMEDKNLSRNASSSRAIPVKTMIREVMERPAIPLFWGANQKGMQAGAECDELVMFEWTKLDREAAWLRGRDQMVRLAQAFADAGYHKQIVNRLLEPWGHIKVVATATEWDNFHALRDHDKAEPHIRLLSQRMQAAVLASIPRKLGPGEWHLPYVTLEEREVMHGMKFFGVSRMDPSSGGIPLPIKLSVARCARTSYRTHEGLTPRPAEDIALYNALAGHRPPHASPTEHQATPYFTPVQEPSVTGNFHGWRQFRKIIE